MTALTKTDKEKFRRLINECASANNGTRILARLKLNKFVINHTKEECQKAYDEMKGERKTQMADFKPGDVVCLMGTRMKMTVERLEDEGVYCLWFDRDSQLNRYPFPIHILESADD
jgi:uncharacterized protein YodC (DUF2158 family)